MRRRQAYAIPGYFDAKQKQVTGAPDGGLQSRGAVRELPSGEGGEGVQPGGQALGDPAQEAQGQARALICRHCGETFATRAEFMKHSWTHRR